MSISGNMASQIVVSLLILFLIPYIHFYTSNVGRMYNGSDTYWIKTTNETMPSTHSCSLTDYYDTSKCLINKDLGIYYSNFTKEKVNNYTIPFKLISETKVTPVFVFFSKVFISLFVATFFVCADKAATNNILNISANIFFNFI